jgi:hypothetical protein
MNTQNYTASDYTKQAVNTFFQKQRDAKQMASPHKALNLKSN